MKECKSTSKSLLSSEGEGDHETAGREKLQRLLNIQKQGKSLGFAIIQCRRAR